MMKETDMNAAAKIFPQSSLSPEEYLEGEQYSEIKHEYVDGDVYAMAGTSDAHNLISGNLFALLHSELRGKPCRVFFADIKTAIQTIQKTRFYYPDIQVTCAEDDTDPYVKRHPKLIIEVLSPSTERKDRAEKFYTYRALDSLQEYVLVAQEVARVEVYRRRTGWDLEMYGAGEEFHLESVDLRIAVADVYEQVAVKAEPKELDDDDNSKT
jgi:Uma2 family endonuclease